MRALLLALPLALAPAAVQAQDHGAMDHAAMGHAPAASAPAAPPPEPHAGHAMPQNAAGTALPAGDAPAPPAPADHYADAFFPPAEMERARARMMREEGGQRFAQVFANIAEVSPGGTYRWDAEGWWGGDIDRLVVKTEGEGRGAVDDAEVQALWSHAIGPYFDLQAGLRQDLGPAARRTHAAIGVEGLAPYWFETEATLFLSTRGEVQGRIEGWYDQRITQRLVLQPRVELNLSAQDSPATRTGAGLSEAEAGVRLRYEIAREFAPYLGVSWQAKAGRTARYARADGDDPATVRLVAGIRFWF